MASESTDGNPFLNDYFVQSSNNFKSNELFLSTLRRLVELPEETVSRLTNRYKSETFFLVNIIYLSWETFKI